MRTHFAEVLARESDCLAEVTDEAMPACWRRRRVVVELMTPRSPHVLALQQTDEVPERAHFLDQWRELIAETVDRVLQTDAEDTLCPSARGPKANVDAQKTAVLILAALYGSRILSQLVQDPRPLNAALDLALVPFVPTEDNILARTVASSPISNMDS
jgi:hypothetical protein